MVLSNIDVLYTFTFSVIAGLTVPAFDADVWMRDVDSSPSPFPPDILFAYYCPRLARRLPATRSFFVNRDAPQEISQHGCLSTCDPDCHFNGHSKAPLADAAQTRPLPKNTRVPPVLPHTLIRIPNSAELRAVIHVELPPRTS